MGGMAVTSTMEYNNLSLFFAFASLFPDMMVLLFFIIPVKVKWLAYLDAAWLLYGVVSLLLKGAYISALAAGAGDFELPDLFRRQSH